MRVERTGRVHTSGRYVEADRARSARALDPLRYFCGVLPKYS